MSNVVPMKPRHATPDPCLTVRDLHALYVRLTEFKSHAAHLDQNLSRCRDFPEADQLAMRDALARASDSIELAADQILDAVSHGILEITAKAILSPDHVGDQPI
jgi:hypothetical protein